MNNPISAKLTEGDILIEWHGSNIDTEDGLGQITGPQRKALLQLQELEFDGTIVAVSAGTWSLGYDSIDELEPDHLSLLGLPMPAPLKAKVYTNRSDTGRFRRLALDLRSEAAGILNDRERRGPFIQIADDLFILPEKPIRDLQAHLSAGPDPSKYESEVAAQQAYHAEAKRMATTAGADLESWLERENYEYAESVGVTMEGDLESGVTLHTHAEGVDDEELQALVDQNQGNRSVVWRGSGRERKRLILKPRQRKAIEELHKQGKHIAAADVADFMDNPEGFLPPDIDLSDFSDRVKGLRIRVYDSRPYVHMRKEQLRWIPEVGVNFEATDGTGDAHSAESTDRPPEMSSEEYKAKVKQALEEGRTNFTHEGAVVHFDPRSAEAIDELDRLPDLAKEQGISGTRRYILDIFENLDALEFSIDDDEETVEDEAPSREIMEFPTPSSLQATLRPFQITGYNWLRTLDHRKRGGLLADDMGLGKTLQVISYLAAMSEEDCVSPSLAVLPKTLIQNWFGEIKRFCPDLRVAHYSGGRIVDSSVFSGIDLVMTTYDTLRINQIDLARVDWMVVICDEAQAIKNPTTGRTTAVKSLKSRMRIAMTGTPVENGLLELWSIMDWVQPGLLRSRQEFRTEHERPIVAAEDDDSRRRQVGALQKRIIDHYLRRMKTEVLDGLPPKNFHKLQRPLSHAQLTEYLDRVESARNGGRGAMLGCLQELLRLSACPWPEEEAYSITGTSADLERCPKLATTLGKLDQIKEKGEKALIFVERLATQGMLQSVLFHRYGIQANLINGKITSGRQAIVDRFNGLEGFQVLILSPRVGGTGLNITSANHVIHYMRPWNPAIENQATDRVYRIGQEKEVHVYLPIATWPDGNAESVEQVLDKLIESKMELATDVIVPTARMSLDKEVMDQVFRPQPTASN